MLNLLVLDGQVSGNAKFSGWAFPTGDQKHALNGVWNIEFDGTSNLDAIEFNKTYCNGLSHIDLDVVFTGQLKLVSQDDSMTPSLCPAQAVSEPYNWTLAIILILACLVVCVAIRFRGDIKDFFNERKRISQRRKRIKQQGEIKACQN